MTLWSNGKWAVTPDGLASLENLETSPYIIGKTELGELQPGLERRGVAKWPLHLAEKSWVDVPSIMEAFEKALEFHNPVGGERIDLDSTRVEASKRKVS